MITLEPQDLDRFGLTFVCGTCHHGQSVMLEREKDGTVWYISSDQLYRSQWLLSSLSWVQTDEGKLLISCGYCRSGRTVIAISQDRDGISPSIEKSKLDKNAVLLIPSLPEQEQTGISAVSILQEEYE